MDFQYLLTEATDAPPGGSDLEYDPAYLALEIEARGKPEQDAAGTIVPAVEPDWPQVLAQSQALLVRSKDLRVAMQLMRATTRVEHLAGFADSAAFVAELLARYWADLHPRLDADDDNDPTLRLNALAPLEPPRGAGGSETLLRDLRDAAVVPPTPQGKVTVRDLLIAEGRLPSAPGAVNVAAIDGLLREAIAHDAAVADVPARALAAVQRVRTLVAEQVGSELAPDVTVVTDMLKPIVQRMARLTGRDVDPEGAEPGTPGPVRSSGPIQRREDVIHAIDALCDYLERTEPTNPAPLLLRRAQRLMNKSFVELIADLAPDGVGQVKLVAGIKDE